MSDETENVDAGSDTSGEQAVDATSQEAASTENETTSADTSSNASQDAEGAADANIESGNDTSGDAAPDTNESRTGFVNDKGLRPGDQCICPDGRKGTVHSFDAGFVCIPNHDQSE